jgi:hypothetical protein
LISISSRFVFLGEELHPGFGSRLRREKGGTGRRVSWSVENGPSQKDRWPQERKGKRKKEKKMRQNNKEGKGKEEKLNWEFQNLKIYQEKNKMVFHEIGFKGIYKKRKIKGLNTKDSQR